MQIVDWAMCREWSDSDFNYSLVGCHNHYPAVDVERQMIHFTSSWCQSDLELAMVYFGSWRQEP